MPTGIDLPSEATGYHTGVSDALSQAMYFSIGQFDTYTPIQMAQYVSTIANNGLRMQPHLLKEVREPSDNPNKLGKLLYHFEPNILNKIEMNEKYYNEAVENQKNYIKKTKMSEDKILFYCCLAEDYQINPLDNSFYFFNPFSIQIFMNIINNILISVEQSKREVEIILYYSSDDYIYFLENQTAFELKQEIILADAYKKNQNERFLVYRLTY